MCVKKLITFYVTRWFGPNVFRKAHVRLNTGIFGLFNKILHLMVNTGYMSRIDKFMVITSKYYFTEK